MQRGKRPVSRHKPKRIRIHPRFFLFVLLLVLIVLLLWLGLRSTSSKNGTAYVQANSLGTQFQGEIVVVREEKLYDTEVFTKIDFVAAEGERVYKGNVLCHVYSSGYSQTEITKLDNTREAIQQYHRDNVLYNYVDPKLEKLDEAVNNLAFEVRTLVQGLGIGSLTNLEKQLALAISSRQTYLRTKYPDDQTLISLYKEETNQLRKIDSWTTTYPATTESFVSFYTDGYELSVNSTNYEDITPQQTRAVLSGQKLEIDTVSRGRQPIYRTVSPDTWYALLLSSDKSWNPVVGQTYKMQLEGFESYLVDAVVKSFTRSGGELLVRLQIDSDVKPVLNIRTCRVVVGEFIEGLTVPRNALRIYDDMIGVVVSGVQGEIFVPVQVLSQEEKTAFVRPLSAGSLFDGQQILTFAE